jgi:23S rRNA (adenine2503-C2)-methyltransferase
VQHPVNHIFEQTPESLAAWCERQKMPSFRAEQILEWVYEKGIADPALMSNLSKLDRERLAAGMTFLSGQVLTRQAATDGVQKLLIDWDDFPPPRSGEGRGGVGTNASDSESVQAVSNEVSLPVVNGARPGAQGGPANPTPALPAAGRGTDRQTECVMIPSQDMDDERPEPSRFTACISSQVGCPVGCRFCASGLGGLDANLSAGRIVEQVWRLGRLEGVRRITNVVFMGMGEPLSNLQNVIPAIRTITALWGLGISARKITVSTVGLPKAIDKLSEQLDLPVTLALSLHAPSDELRRQLIPWAEYTTIKDLLAACQRWFDKTGREITLEYTLLRGVNDRPEHAEQLAQVARTLRANVNLIRYNEVTGLPFGRPQTEDVRRFQEVLRARRINAHIRASRGRDIAAACGQLRHESSTPSPGGVSRRGGQNAVGRDTASAAKASGS